MQHGRKKTSRAGNSTRALHNSKLIAAYNQLKDRVLLRVPPHSSPTSKRNGNHAKTTESLQGTTQLLNENPEFYTIWNYRRTILLHVDDLRMRTDLIRKDLEWILDSILKLNPKSYWIWSYRRWCLDLLNSGDHYGSELVLVDQFLKLDPRNFHAWGYRQYIVSNLILPTLQNDNTGDLYMSEFQFTTLKINSCMNNYSAWHYRSTILFKWLDSNNYRFTDIVDKELDLLHNAMFTEPMGQSHWLYHRWFMTKSKLHIDQTRLQSIVDAEINLLLELESEEPDCKWVTGCLVFLYGLNNNTHLKNQNVLKLQAMDPDRLNYYQTLLT